MKQTAKHYAIGITLALCAAPALAAQVNIAAIVNDSVITTTDVNERRDLIMATANIPATVENQQKITPRIVQTLIDENLQLQNARSQNLNVTDEELKKAVDSMGARGESGETIRDFIAKNGLSMRSLENQIRAQLAWGKVVQRKLRRNVTIAQDEVTRAQKAAAAAPGEAELRMQMVEVASAGKPEAAQKQAEEIAQQLKTNNDLSALAARYPQAQNLQLNAPVWVTEEKLPPALQQVIRTLQPGDVATPLRTEGSYQVLQLLERKTVSKTADATEYVIKQIAIGLPKSRDKASLAALSAAAATVRANPGDCMSEAVAKIDLPTEVKFARARIGDMSPPQRALVSRLEVGDISEPLAAPDALRLVMVCEKIEPASGSLPDGEAIRKQLFAEKMELEAQKHLRNLRRDAFIDIKGAN